MADAAVTFLLENLQELITREANLLIGVKENVSWIETEFRVMVAFLQWIEALDQLPEEVNNRIKETRQVILKAEGLIETYVKKARQAAGSASIIKWLIYVPRLSNIARKLGSIKTEIVQVRKGWGSVPFTTNNPRTPQHHQESSYEPVQACVEWLAGEIAPLRDFLREIENILQVQVLGERQKIWIQEVRDILPLIDELLQDFEAPREGLLNKLLLLPICEFSDSRKDVVSEIQTKILQIYRRYYVYGLGEILVNNGSRYIFPRIRMATPIPDISSQLISRPEKTILLYVLEKSTEQFREKSTENLGIPSNTFVSNMPSVHERRAWRTTYSWLMPTVSIESLRVDLKLMKALLDDTRSMGDLNERAKVWLNQMHEISVALEDLCIEYSRQGTKGTKLGRKLKEIAYQIHDIAVQKMTYGIGSAMEEARLLGCNSFEDQVHDLLLNNEAKLPPHVELFIPKADLRKRVEVVRRELQLMKALFEDVNRMGKLDERLKVWVEELLVLSREANSVVEAGHESFSERFDAAARIKQVFDHIHTMYTWKHIYDIGYVQPSSSGTFSHNLNETESFSSIAAVERKEIKLMQALYSDVKKMDEENIGIADAWFEEINKLDENAEGMISSEVMDKIRQLSEIRIAYGIEPRKRFHPYIIDRQIQVKKELFADHARSCIIPIVGMGNADKEALQELINNDDITCHLDWWAWVCIPQKCSATSILENMAKQIMEQQKSLGSASNMEAPTEEELIQMLQEILMHKRYLIVLDEIQEIEVCNFLERAFQNISTGSRIIVITNEDTCSLLNSSTTANLVVPVTLRNLPSQIGQVMPGSDALNNYQSVPPYLRQCLYYFLLFPADLEVPTRRLIVLWVAEGLVRESGNGNESVEHAAEGYLNKLIELKMVDVTDEKPNGKVKACRLSRGTRDEWLMLAAQESRFFQDTSGMISRLVDHHGTSDSCFIQINGNTNSATSLQNYKNILSFLSFYTEEGSKPGEEIGNFLHKCISSGCFLELRVLDLEKVFRPKLPKALSRLTLLKYLGLRWTYLEILPEYVKELLNLQVLDVKHTYISILPKSIWRMQYLRHLYLSEAYRTKFAGCPSSVSMTELQTLWGAFIDENTMVEEGLDTLRNIRKLGLSCQSRSSCDMQKQLEAITNWITKLEFLENLRLKSRDEDGKASKLHLGTLASNQKLSTVYLLGKLQQTVVPTFPIALVEITLSGSELPEDPMKYLEKLPNLLILRLLARSVMCSTMHCSKECFPKLKVLKIWKLESLVDWEVNKEALPALEDLEIRACDNLEMLPNELQHVTTLRKFTLTSMPETFIKETRDRQSELWAKIVPQVE